MTKSTDPTTARQLVEEDMRNSARAAAKAGLPIDYVSYEHGLDPTEAPEGTFINLTIGTRDDLTKRAADAAAHAFREVRRRHPQARSTLLYDWVRRCRPYQPAPPGSMTTTRPRGSC
jgi:hypothetical protein